MLYYGQRKGKTHPNKKEGGQKTMKTETIEAIIKYFQENDDLFTDCIEELDGYNGYLGDDRMYQMEDLSEIYHDEDPLEILRRAFYGHDDETYTTDERGEKHYGEFNPNRDYFYFNGYGNLVSCDYKDYSDKLDSYFVEQLQQYRQYIYSIERDAELEELFDKLEEEDE